MLLSTVVLTSLLAAAPALAAPASSSISSKSGGAVASEVAECSEIGIQVLKDGGNAVDGSSSPFHCSLRPETDPPTRSVIATGLCVGTINAFHSGIGGGGELYFPRGILRGQTERLRLGRSAPSLAFAEFHLRPTPHIRARCRAQASALPILCTLVSCPGQ